MFLIFTPLNISNGTPKGKPPQAICPIYYAVNVLRSIGVKDKPINICFETFYNEDCDCFYSWIDFIIILGMIID